MGLGYFLIFLSLLFFFVGVLFHIGKFKGWWLNSSNPVTPVGIFYVLIPASLCFFITGFLMLLPLVPERRGDLALYIVMPLLIVAVVLGTWQPSWLKPKWLNWLETNYPHHVKLLHDEAQRMGAREWEKRVRTQEGLENWVAEVLEKNNATSEH